VSAGRGADLERAIEALRRDRLVVYPTETFYGVGARARSSAAVRACAALKGRDAGKPIALIAADAGMLDAVVAATPPLAAPLMRRFWPGPLTLVLPARDDLPPELTAGSGRIGIRVSSHPVARALATGAGEPITATSANRAGAEPAIVVDDARRALGDAVAVYVDGGTLGGGSASTVVVVGHDAITVVRAGAIGLDALRDTLGSVPIVSAT
jgi:L-threonylcarbamoyladenylate synthase